MTTLLHFPAPVHSIQLVGLPETCPDGSEPFTPSSEDLAYDTGFTVGREDGAFTAPADWTHLHRLRFASGRLAGREARERDDARALGFELALISDAGEPPAGLRRHEAEGWREGFRAGLVERDARDAADAEYDSWADSLAALDEMYGNEVPGFVTDRDIYRAGCMS